MTKAKYYTDRRKCEDARCKFSYTAQMTMHLPDALEGLPLNNLKKLFKLYIQSTDLYVENETTLRSMNYYIQDWTALCKDAKEYEDSRYKLNLINVSALPKQSKAEKEKAKDARIYNRGLEADRREMRDLYERSLKVKDAWKQALDKYQ